MTILSPHWEFQSWTYSEFSYSSPVEKKKKKYIRAMEKQRP